MSFQKVQFFWSKSEVSLTSIVDKWLYKQQGRNQSFKVDNIKFQATEGNGVFVMVVYWID